MLAENHSVPSTSCTHLPARVGLPDGSPPGRAATAPVNRGAHLARLGDRIAELSARIQAATHELLVLIREFDDEEGGDGCQSCARWLSWRAGLSPGAAPEHVRVARALGKLPKLSDAMRRGKVSYSKVRAVTRVATPENEQTLLDVALAGTAAHVERIARAWRRIDRNVEQVEKRRRDASRELRTWVDEDGMVVVRGRLAPEVGAVLRGALEAACDQARRVPESDGDAGEEAADAPAGVKEEATDASVDADRADARAATGGRHRGGGRGGVGRRARPGDGRRPVSSGVARGHRGAGETPGRSRGNVRGSGVRVGAAARRRPRARGKVGDRPRGGGRSWGRIVDTDGSVGPRSTRPTTATVPHVRPVSWGTADGTRIRPAGIQTATSAARAQRSSPGRCAHRLATSASATSAARAACSQTVLDDTGGIHVSAETARRMACDAPRSPCTTAPAATSSTSVAAPGPSHRHCAGRSRPATGGAGSRAAATFAAMLTM